MDIPSSVPAWVRAEPARLLGFAARAAHPGGGFAWLDDGGRPVLDRPVETWITCRMTHVFALAHLQGADTGAQVAHGVEALTGLLRDPDHDGWYATTTLSEKRAYEHAFVVLAASSAVADGAEGAEPLLAGALDVVERRFWEPGPGRVADVWDRGWTHLEDYRGANANMHSVEAFLAAADVTGDRVWATRALSIVEHLVHGEARAHGWLLPEHYDAGWHVRLDHNRDEPAHPFRPFGATIGHLFEWARLAVHLKHALGADAPEWLVPDAEALFATAVRHGWAVDGRPGFVYTTDFAGTPVVRTRLHWVVAEAIAAAWTLHQETGEAAYLDRFTQWCDHAEACFVDRELGSWHHELDPENRPAAAVWAGKPDIYHAYQATLLPTLKPAASFAGALITRG
ncbi:Mannose or cellobiose epimerase, N-acyl-D-glucosamine 2-epimerase family [Amycolatopsis pretoriensis]|uniref:Mannose or cellobiose epimerase, N-acyl-D-glucosamine 2-epimerase family n=1 Tax=Amycolatopsis pretoriensis TaxID=218821 RepID=A0A1H5QBA9_9PSEU|nr:AGE family epimerase/isomerase [Amycolatopsis pretoriensis]SEF23154.1 Mannose or cellobiose epimerase, N-acyl-D-glucosamine 2-epimerase family [Amycolatopsis pretoriensis]